MESTLEGRGVTGIMWIGFWNREVLDSKLGHMDFRHCVQEHDIIG
jgi:hypothetical protein